MQLFLGDKKCNKFYVGNMKVTYIYASNKLIYSEHPFAYDYYYPNEDKLTLDKSMDNFITTDACMKVKDVQDNYLKVTTDINKSASLEVVGDFIEPPIVGVSTPFKIKCTQIQSPDYHKSKNIDNKTEHCNIEHVGSQSCTDICNLCTDRTSYDKVRDKKTFTDSSMVLSYSIDNTLHATDYVSVTEGNILEE